jgi:hypothetical protein
MRPPFLIVVSFHLPPPLQKCRPHGSTTGMSTTPLFFLPSARQTCMKGRGAQQRRCHNPLRCLLLFVTGCAGEAGTSQLLSWPPSSFAFASLAVIAVIGSIATRHDEAVNHVVVVRHTSAHTTDSIAPQCTRRRRAPAAAQERCPMEGRGPVAAAAVGVAFIVRRRFCSLFLCGFDTLRAVAPSLDSIDHATLGARHHPPPCATAPQRPIPDTTLDARPLLWPKSTLSLAAAQRPELTPFA